MSDPQNIIPMAATLLRELASKPREQIHFNQEGLKVLRNLQIRGMVSCHPVSSINEQNIWSLTATGLCWLEQHGLFP